MNINNTHGSQKDVLASEPRVYEIGYHILSSVDEENIEKERDALVAIITKYKGLVISEEIPALIDLAYDIDKIIDNKRQVYSQAYFGWIKFDLDPEFISQLEAEVSQLKSVLRFILIKTVRENTIFSERPYKLAKTDTLNNQTEEIDEVEDEEILDDSPVENDEIIEEKETETELEKTEEVKEEEIKEEVDDLTKIEGIGPKIAEIFQNAGIKTFADLSESKIADLRKILEEHKLSSHDPKTWSKQATLAKNGKWEKLAELQDELKGGK